MLSTVKACSLLPYPVLYSLQNCPYAMRARMAILLAKYPVSLRAIVLKDKPLEMLNASAKGTVPVLVIDKTDSSDQPLVIDESLDIMLWALRQSDPNHLLCRDEPELLPSMLNIIERFDNQFKACLEDYKCAKRYHEDSKVEHRRQCETFILELENRLSKHKYLTGEQPRLLDYAILPYIRQFARVDRQWYLQAPYPKLQNWLKAHLASALFSKTMKKYPLWKDAQQSFLIGAD